VCASDFDLKTHSLHDALPSCDEFRLPPAATQAVELPSPALLWAALGVFRAPPGGTLASATAGEGGASLTYGEGEERFGFRAEERSEEHTSELQSRENLVCRLL